MSRLLPVCSMMLLAIAGIAHAQEEAAPAEAAPAATSEVDVIWQPTVDQLSAWVSEGITAAAAELDFFDMPVIGRMTWSSDEGVPLVGDRALRFAALTTPELASYVVGYGAAWEEDAWSAIEQDVDSVANDLATSLHASMSGGPMYFAIAVSGPEYPDMMAAVYYYGQWRALAVRPWGTMAEYTPETVGQAMADPLWAAKYLLTQGSSEADVQPAEQARVYLCTWDRNASTELDADFRAELPQPEWTNPKRARLTVGNADLLAWVEFDMVAVSEQSHQTPVYPEASYEPVSAAPATQDNTVVYVTETGDKFHLLGCRYLDQSAFALSRSEALAQGYEPCSVCRP